MTQILFQPFQRCQRIGLFRTCTTVDHHVTKSMAGPRLFFPGGEQPQLHGFGNELIQQIHFERGGGGGGFIWQGCFLRRRSVAGRMCGGVQSSPVQQPVRIGQDLL